MSTAAKIIDACFSASKNVRYVAAYLDNQLELKSRADVHLLGSNESDQYEEIIVNPTLLKLVSQRGQYGLWWLQIRDRALWLFYAFIYPPLNGHVTVGFELNTKLDDEAQLISEVIDRAIGETGSKK